VKKTLILWDIDGTLIRSGGAGARALERALEASFGVPGDLSGVEFAGRTDPWIIRSAFAKHAICDTAANRQRLIDAYLEVLPAELANPDACVLPGIRTLLQASAEASDCAQGLLTGNLRRGAEVKLRHHRLWDYFPFGAFADDSETRNELGPFACRRASEHWGVPFAPEQTWIVGDTPHDIGCARAVGARVLAVATGGFKAGELAALGPDALLDDLSDAQAAWAILRS
jgi:phosphoglycolate phosphatase-like HAD superfamily hydrolase